MNAEPCLLHARALFHQSMAQRRLFTGLYFQGFKNQTEEQRAESNGNREMAKVECLLGDANLLDMIEQLGDPINASKYAGPFSVE